MSKNEKPKEDKKTSDKKLEVTKESVRKLNDKPTDSLRPAVQTSDCGAGGCHP